MMFLITIALFWAGFIAGKVKDDIVMPSKNDELVVFGTSFTACIDAIENEREVAELEAMYRAEASR